MNAQSQKTVKLRGAQNPYIRVPQRAVSRGGLCLGAESRLRLFLRLASVLINLSGSRVLGFAVLSAQHIISYLIRFKYLPFFVSVFSNHGFSEDAGLPSVGFSCAYFCLFAAIIVACILRAVRHVDLKITVGTRI